MPMGITRDSQVSVVSLEIPRFPSSHSRFPGFRRLTRDSWVSVVSLEIPVFPIFLLKISGKIVKIVFSDSRDQNKILKFLDFFKIFIYGQYFLYKPLFPSSQASKTLKIKTARPKSTRGGDPLIAHSDHRGPVSAQLCGLSCLFLTLS